MDDLTPEQRRKNMQAIKSKDTSIEIALRTALWHRGIRYRKNYKQLPGKPDFVITKHKIAIFCLENPISLLQSIKLPYSVIRIIGTVMTGRIGIRELSQIVIIGSLKLSEI